MQNTSLRGVEGQTGADPSHFGSESLRTRGKEMAHTHCSVTNHATPPPTSTGEQFWCRFAWKPNWTIKWVGDGRSQVSPCSTGSSQISNGGGENDPVQWDWTAVGDISKNVQFMIHPVTRRNVCRYMVPAAALLICGVHFPRPLGDTWNLHIFCFFLYTHTPMMKFNVWMRHGERLAIPNKKIDQF